MNIDEVLQQLNEQRSKLEAAIQALEGFGGRGKRRGRPPGSAKHRGMSVAARKRISQAMKKRWAARKRGQK